MSETGRRGKLNEIRGKAFMGHAVGDSVTNQECQAVFDYLDAMEFAFATADHAAWQKFVDKAEQPRTDKPAA